MTEGGGRMTRRAGDRLSGRSPLDTRRSVAPGRAAASVEHEQDDSDCHDGYCERDRYPACAARPGSPRARLLIDRRHGCLLRVRSSFERYWIPSLLGTTSGHPRADEHTTSPQHVRAAVADVVVRTSRAM